MPRFDDERQALLRSSENTKNRLRDAWDGFQNFALTDNVLEVAVGLVIAAAFTAVVKSFVSNILLPPISLLPFLDKNMQEKFAVLRGGGTDAKTTTYNTLKQAQADGAVVMAYGDFIDKVIYFFAMALSLFAVGHLYQWASGDKVIKRTVKCKYCRKRISQKAQRCLNCTSWQDGREEQS